MQRELKGRRAQSRPWAQSILRWGESSIQSFRSQHRRKMGAPRTKRKRKKFKQDVSLFKIANNTILITSVRSFESGRPPEGNRQRHEEGSPGFAGELGQETARSGEKGPESVSNNFNQALLFSNPSLICWRCNVNPSSVLFYLLSCEGVFFFIVYWIIQYCLATVANLTVQFYDACCRILNAQRCTESWKSNAWQIFS